MHLTVDEIAKMMDLSCVRTTNTEEEITQLVQTTRKYRAGQVSTMQCYIPFVKELLNADKSIKVVGNVSFPSGSDTTSLKVLQTREMVEMDCDEIDVVMNVGQFLSGKYEAVEADLNAVIKEAKSLPVKVIVETPYLNKDQIIEACDLCLRVGATFIKTGTGWAPEGTSLEDVALIKAIVGDRIKIKASGGIRDLDSLVEMYKVGARRFGVNLKSGVKILNECIDSGGSISF